ncbi:hypothetical protein V5735_00175 (plasmid) [Haladaptatus sp. SPP-AMP-3]|uniref:hypothetical protein n=1 Tax=Haladaptatus sp. SPP-AMP-3 TaxID=3121295 RepID=UPI003C2FF240
MADNERKPTWPQIRDALEDNEDCLCSAWLTGSFVNPTKEITQESDVDVVLSFESVDAMDEFDYDGRYPETIVAGGITLSEVRSTGESSMSRRSIRE